MSSATSTTRAPVTHTVQVGNADYTFVPDVVMAEVGDYIEYAFYPANHSVVRAHFEYPCIPYEMVGTNPGFYSGFKPVDTILDEPPTFTVRVNDTDPIFVYCSGTTACMGHGMVAVVNPNANTSLEVHRQMALESQMQLNPGDDWPTEGGPTPSASNSHASSTASSSTPATGTATPPPASTSNSVAPSHQALSTGAIAGIAIGGALVLLLAGIAIWICGRRSRRQNPDNPHGVWFLGDKRDPSQPPAYSNPHAAPAMTNKGYAGASVVEQPVGYGVQQGQPQMSPYIQQYPPAPHVVDPSVFQHNPYIPQQQAQMQPHGPIGPLMGSPQPTHQQHQSMVDTRYMSEMYSGPSSPTSTVAPMSSIANTNMNNNGDRTSTITSQSQSGGYGHPESASGAYSRAGSPEVPAEMNALRSPVGTVLNQERQ